jgi:hypothetical protein
MLAWLNLRAEAFAIMPQLEQIPQLSPAPFLKLSPELMMHTFSFLCNQKEIYPCLFICRQVLKPAQASIHRELVFRGGERLQMFLSYVLDRPHIQPNVRSLKVQAYGHNKNDEKTLKLSSMLPLLLALRGLRSLTFDILIIPQAQLLAQAVRLLPSLRELNVGTYTWGPAISSWTSVSWSNVSEMISGSDITSLCLQHIVGRSPRFSWPPLEELGLDGLSLTDRDLGDILKALTSPGLRKLHISNCQALTGRSLLHIKLFASSLEDLFLGDIDDPYDSVDEHSYFSGFSVLRKLRLADSMVKGPALLSISPSSLESLVLSYTGIGPVWIINAVSRQRPPGGSQDPLQLILDEVGGGTDDDWDAFWVSQSTSSLYLLRSSQVWAAQQNIVAELK